MAKRPLLDNLIRRLSIDSGEKKRPAEDNEILLEREGPLFWGTFWLITSTEMFYVFLSVGWSHCACRSKAYPRPCLQHSAGRICGVDDAVGEYCYSVLIFGLLSAPRFVCFALVSPPIVQLRSDWSGRGHPLVIQEVRNAFRSDVTARIPLSILLSCLGSNNFRLFFSFSLYYPAATGAEPVDHVTVKDVGNRKLGAAEKSCSSAFTSFDFLVFSISIRK